MSDPTLTPIPYEMRPRGEKTWWEEKMGCLICEAETTMTRDRRYARCHECNQWYEIEDDT